MGGDDPATAASIASTSTGFAIVSNGADYRLPGRARRVDRRRTGKDVLRVNQIDLLVAYDVRERRREVLPETLVLRVIADVRQVGRVERKLAHCESVVLALMHATVRARLQEREIVAARTKPARQLV